MLTYNITEEIQDKSKQRDNSDKDKNVNNISKHKAIPK